MGTRLQSLSPPPPNQNPFQAFLQNIGRKWNLEGKFDILVTEIRFVNLMSFFLSSNDSMSFQKC
jgi:hypothetical protein